jgi:cytochrome c-type biogenesis protein CcmH
MTTTKVSPIQNKFLLVILLALAFSGIIWRGVQAQQTAPTPSDDQVNSVAKTMYCPVCENIPLDVCPTQACAQWRDLIRVKLSQGWTNAQIQDYFAVQYGDRVLAQPPARGLNWLVYLLPPVVILFGAFILFRVLKGMRAPARKPSVPVNSPPPSSDPYLAKLEEELKRRK